MHRALWKKAENLSLKLRDFPITRKRPPTIKNKRKRAAAKSMSSKTEKGNSEKNLPMVFTNTGDMYFPYH